MTSIICDITKKAIPKARREVNYFTIRNKTLSEEGKEIVETKVKTIMKEKSPYTMSEYWDTYWNIVVELSA